MSTTNQQPSDEHLSPTAANRNNRFAGSGAVTPRSASQPPKTSNGDGDGSLNDALSMASPAMQIYGVAASNSNSRETASQEVHPSAERGSYNPSSFASAMRESRSFSSTFEDDESEADLDETQQQFMNSSFTIPRGRNYQVDVTRSRSQSLATMSRPAPIGSPLATHSNNDWSQHSSAMSIPSRYNANNEPGSRYGSLGTMGRSPINIHGPTSPQTLHVQNGFSSRHGQVGEISNISPFVRDVAQIMVDNGAAYREVWGAGGVPGEGGPGSGTTSRRHSVSIVQPRRGVVGFDAPDLRDEGFSLRTGGFGGGLTIDDDDLAADLEALNFGSGLPSNKASTLPTSQPSSLPIYAPVSRSAMEATIAEQFAQDMHDQRLSVSPAASRSRNIPSEGGSSPGKGQDVSGMTNQRMRPSDLKMDFSHVHLQQQAINQQQQRFGNQYGADSQMSPSMYVRSATGPNQSFMQNPVMSPISPTGMRSQNELMQQQQPQTPTSATHPGQLNDLGKGVPLHAVPPTWRLFIVEFKAGRTDLFHYLPGGLAPPIRVGDLVIVEADRGHDLGKVVNDTITLAEVEAFQRQQQAQAQAQAAYGDHGPVSPDGPGPGHSKKEILSKQILSKATENDARRFSEKEKDEAKALQFCQKKVRDKGLPMEVIDAEYQWDRRKLTFYFVAEKRIDFRELVRELFRTYKTRIWMASLQGLPSE
ncbi:PSP1-domain-containing protein [Schizopora paradoxa]|uniref:PSP1-domain-containing protein n=1 Tax=Schizopora paradoxa TaxID=27342 RepID=A0A0H2S0T8_9AGAM|nr:PSP1-domain-containing protein [Schizopora paradoxa]